MMIKQILIFSFLGISLTGCIVAPYEDSQNRHGSRYDHKYNDGRWNRDDRRRWDNQRHNDRRDWGKERPYWYER